MNYLQPKLHVLGPRGKMEGNCANGTAASAWADSCTAGVGINSGGGSSSYCKSGNGDGNYCSSGVAAKTSGGSGRCLGGSSPNSTCGTGGTPA
jgi:hypothetical protein